MFSFNLRVANPFNNSSNTNTWFWQDWSITKNKHIEIQIGNWRKLISLFELDMRTFTTGHDHAGPSFELTILWFFVMIKIYDRRHWDYDNHMWEVA